MLNPAYMGCARKRASVSTWSANNATLQPLDTNLVAYWKGEDLTDEINSHTLTNVGSATFTAGKRDNAFTLNGSSQYFTAPDSADWALGNNFTISIWFNPSAIGATPGVLFVQGESGNTNRFYSYINTSKIQFTIYKASLLAVNLSHNVTLSTSTWYHVVIVANGTNYKLYLNGIEETSIVNSTTITDFVGLLYLGAFNGPERFSGKLDEVFIMKGHGMSQAEVQALYNSSTGAYLIGDDNSSSSDSSSSSSSSPGE